MLFLHRWLESVVAELELVVRELRFVSSKGGLRVALLFFEGLSESGVTELARVG